MNRLSDMTWPEVEDAIARGATTVILPLGATEQHGPHLPLGTDTLLAAALAERLAARMPGVLIAPVLPVGCSDEHAGFPGLLSLDTATLAGVLIDCARRMLVWGVRRLVIVSAHGGNGDALALAAERIGRELLELRLSIPGELYAAGAVRQVAQSEGIPLAALGLHAGEGETSQLLHVCPELVRLDRAAPGFVGDMEQILPVLRMAGLQPVTPNGVLGDPSPAQAERGARYLDAQADSLAAELRFEF
jgi:mycofactocin system creatininase family protein